MRVVSVVSEMSYEQMIQVQDLPTMEGRITRDMMSITGFLRGHDGTKLM